MLVLWPQCLGMPSGNGDFHLLVYMLVTGLADLLMFASLPVTIFMLNHSVDDTFWHDDLKYLFPSVCCQVFDIMLNGEHIIVQGLDIYDQVGRGTAHDEIIPFTVKNGELKVGGDISSIEGGKVGVSFVKVSWWKTSRLCLKLFIQHNNKSFSWQCNYKTNCVHILIEHKISIIYNM